MLKEHNWHQLKDDTAQRLNQLAPYFRDGKIIGTVANSRW